MTVSLDRKKLAALAADPALSMDQLAIHLGCSTATVRSRLTVYGIVKARTRQRHTAQHLGSTLPPNDPGLCASGERADEIRQLAPWPAGMRFEDARVPAEPFLGKVGPRPTEASGTSTMSLFAMET